MNDEPTMKTLLRLSTTEFTIPQPAGSQVAIPLKDFGHSEKKLGIWCYPACDFGVHVNEIKQKGLQRAEKMRLSRCSPRDAWLDDLRHQLHRQLSYGSVASAHPPDLIEATFQAVWY